MSTTGLRLRTGAATMLQTAAKTALQIGDKGAVTVLQTSATRLQAGEELSEADLKKTRIRPLARIQKLPSTPNPFSQYWEKGSKLQSPSPKLGRGI